MPVKKPIPPPDAPRVCTRCNLLKDVSEFRRSRSYPSGRTPQCNPCIREYVNIYQNTDKGKLKLRNAGLRYKYGIDTAEYNRILAEQGGVCAICGDDPPVRHKRTQTVRFLDVDHNHQTNEVRGLLCMYCNRGLGYLRRASVMQSAVNYLTERGEYVKA